MAVKLLHINKSFGTQRVLKDVSLEIETGQIVGLLGPNGAGKSTLMKILIGLWEADGERANGERAKGERAVIEVPERIGYLPENNPLYEEMYVVEYLRFMAQMTADAVRPLRCKTANAVRPLRCKTDDAVGPLRCMTADAVRPATPVRQEVDELIERVGLTPERNKHIKELSKGYRQRVGLAQALLGDPDLLILDEPTTGLDPNQLVEIRHLIREVGKERTVILSTHIMQEVREMCDRVVILDKGEIKADKKIDEIEDLEKLFRESTNQETRKPGD